MRALERQKSWTDQNFEKFEEKLMMIFFWTVFCKDMDPQQRGGISQRILCNIEIQQRIIKKFHESWWAGHRGIWIIFFKVKDKYWWKGIYKVVAYFVGSCKTSQLYLSNRHRDGDIQLIHWQFVINELLI